MKVVKRAILIACAALVLIVGGLVLYAVLRGRPEDLPWTELDLGQPVGLFTGRKVAGLGRDFAKCRMLLDRAGVTYDVLPPLQPAEPACGYADGVRFARGGSRSLDYLPADLRVACPVAAGLVLWEWNVVQPAAQRHFGKRVSAIEHFGSYSCRRIVGRDRDRWSQHATADAVDIRAFRLADATRVNVKTDWNGGDPARAAFLREVRDGACRLFSIVLSPDYNEAHADHFHFDQSPGGEFGWRGCR